EADRLASRPPGRLPLGGLLSPGLRTLGRADLLRLRRVPLGPPALALPDPLLPGRELRRAYDPVVEFPPLAEVQGPGPPARPEAASPALRGDPPHRTRHAPEAAGGSLPGRGRQ